MDSHSQLLHHHIEFPEDLHLVVQPTSRPDRPIQRDYFPWGRTLGSPYQTITNAATRLRPDHA
jgi:hypothetical protein